MDVSSGFGYVIPMQSPPLLTRPRAETVPVEDLVAWTHAGRIRIPDFQRPPRWRARHVDDLFDSLWQGYPIGNLLLWQRPALDTTLELGPLRIHGAHREDALWVVDGQQRLTALAATLLHPHPTSGSDLYALWFDLENQRFVRPRPREMVPPTWLPLNRVLDAVRLGEWWSENVALAGRSELYRVALQLGRRVRETRLPIYVVETSDADVLKIIFARLNTAGVSMRETEVFNALHAAEGQRNPLDVLADVSREARVGTLEESWRLRCLRVVAGDLLTTPTRRELEGYRQHLETAVISLGAALDFLRDEGHVPHLRLLPYRLPVVALTRFFQLHPNPLPRTRILLRRWLWRGIVNHRHRDTDNAQLRWLSGALDDDEQASVRRLLEDVGSVLPAAIWQFSEHVTETKRTFGAAETKVQGILLAQADPRHLVTGELLDLGQLVEEHGPAALLRLGPPGAGQILHPYIDKPEKALSKATPEIQKSHLCYPDAGGLASRRHAMLESFGSLLSTWCEPGMPDFASLSAELAALGEE